MLKYLNIEPAKLTHLSLTSPFEPRCKEASTGTHEAGKEADDEAVHQKAAVLEAYAENLKDFLSWI